MEIILVTTLEQQTIKQVILKCHILCGNFSLFFRLLFAAGSQNFPHMRAEAKIVVCQHTPLALTHIVRVNALDVYYLLAAAQDIFSKSAHRHD